MAGVTLDTVRKIYAGNVEAVKGVSLGIEDGSFCVLVGPSGCGKSTLAAHDRGPRDDFRREVKIGERVVNEIEPADRDIAMVFQNYALYPHMSVYDNMAYGLKQPRHAQGRDRASACSEAARILAIEPFLDRKPRALSGGQRQRVAMGRAIVRKPQVFLFDEPLSNLDAKLRVQMRVEIKRLQRALGVTSIYVTHDQVEAMTLSDQLVVMNAAARSSRSAPPAEVYRRPADPVRGDLHRLAAHEHPARQGRGRRPRVGRRPDDRRDRHARRACCRLRHRSRPAARRTCRSARAGSSSLDLRRGFRRGTRRDPALPRQDRRRRVRGAGLRPARSPPMPAALGLSDRSGQRPSLRPADRPAPRPRRNGSGGSLADLAAAIPGPPCGHGAFSLRLLRRLCDAPVCPSWKPVRGTSMTVKIDGAKLKIRKWCAWRVAERERPIRESGAGTGGAGAHRRDPGLYRPQLDA